MKRQSAFLIARSIVKIWLQQMSELYCCCAIRVCIVTKFVVERERKIEIQELGIKYSGCGKLKYDKSTEAQNPVRRLMLDSDWSEVCEGIFFNGSWLITGLLMRYRFYSKRVYSTKDEPGKQVKSVSLY